MKKIIGLTLLAVITLPTNAALINDMQSCQGLINFIDKKLDSAPSNYDKDDVKKVRKGLEDYNQYIQQEIVTPGLLKSTGGDKAKASEYQVLVDNYKASLVQQLDARYPQDRLFMDHVVTIDNCAQKAVPSGEELETLKQAMFTMVKLAKLN